MSSDGIPEVQSTWWMTHAAVAAWTLLLYAFILATYLRVSPDRSVRLFVLYGWLFVYVVFGFAALAGNFYDTRAIRDASAEWDPKWWIYVLVSFVLTPTLTGVIYLIQRVRYVGISALGREFGPIG